MKISQLSAWPLWLSMILAAIAFLPSTGGDFVYDDRPQIVGNHLIQEPSLLPLALASDVWAFKGEREQGWSHYWRPAFVALLAAEYALFGAESPWGWHLTNLILHLLVLWLAHRWMGKIGLGAGVRGATLILFALHPAHVESVVWISGSPDLLMAVFTLGCLLMALPAPNHRHEGKAIFGSTLLFALALLTKEAAITLPVLVALQIGLGPKDEHRGRAKRLVGFVTPLVLVVLVYLPARLRVLGHFQIETPWKLSTLDLLANLPQLLTFYLRQAFIPWTLGPSYSIRSITTGELGFAKFWLPVLFCGLLGLCLGVALLKRPLIGLGLLFFGLLLAPAFNISAFMPEQITHDRYLYLPLLGLFLAVFLSLDSLFSRYLSLQDPKVLISLALVLAVPSMALTLHYSKAWESELALWRRGVAVDPSSAFNHAQLGHVLLEAGAPEEALTELNRALAITPVTTALMDRSEILVARRQLKEAERDLRLVVADQGDNAPAVIRLANVLQMQRRIPEAIEVLERGRRADEHRYCALTSNLAVLLVISGEREAALGELNSVQALVGRERHPSCTLVPFHLGTIFREAGEFSKAARKYQEFLRISRGESHEMVTARRQAAASWLERYRSRS